MGLQQITGNEIAAGSIAATDLASASITGDKLGATSINANNIVGGTITTTQIASNTISNTNIQTGAIENYSRAIGLLSGMRNRIINGAMVLNQRNTTVSASNSGWQYAVDRWAAYQSIASSKFTLAGSSTAPTGFTNSLLATSSSAYTVGSTDNFIVRQPIEGFNTGDLDWGTANAKTVTLSFWVRCSVTGTFAGFIQDANAGTAQYPFTYTVNAANTFEYKTVTIVGPTIGSWQTNSNGGPAVVFNMGVGSSFFGTANVWTASAIYGVSGQTNLVATNGATWFLTGVQFEVGTQATTFTTAGGSYGAELALCQRYYWKQLATANYARFGTGVCTGSSSVEMPLKLLVEMRSAPSWSASGSFRIRSNSVVSGVTVGDANQASTWGVLAQITGASGLTSGYAATLDSDAAPTAFIQYSAEL